MFLLSSNKESKVLEIEGIFCRVIYSDRRTLSIEISGEGEIIIRANIRTSDKYIESFVKQKISWIKQKLEKVSKFQPSQISYKEGSSHLYLGQSYKLCLLEDEKESVYINNQDLEIHTQDFSSQQIALLLEAWYTQRALEVFTQHFKVCWQNFVKKTSYKKTCPKLSVKKMKTRWGSLSYKTYRVSLNSQLIKLPVICLDSVICHEFCHLLHSNHSKSFYIQLDEIFPHRKEAEKLLKQFVLR